MEPFLGYAANKSISAGSSKTADIDTAGNLKFSVKAVDCPFCLHRNFVRERWRMRFRIPEQAYKRKRRS